MYILGHTYFVQTVKLANNKNTFSTDFVCQFMMVFLFPFILPFWQKLLIIIYNVPSITYSYKFYTMDHKILQSQQNEKFAKKWGWFLITQSTSASCHTKEATLLLTSSIFLMIFGVFTVARNMNFCHIIISFLWQKFINCCTHIQKSEGIRLVFFRGKN